ALAEAALRTRPRDDAGRMRIHLRKRRRGAHHPPAARPHPVGAEPDRRQQPVRLQPASRRERARHVVQRLPVAAERVDGAGDDDERRGRRNVRGHARHAGLRHHAGGGDQRLVPQPDRPAAGAGRQRRHAPGQQHLGRPALSAAPRVRGVQPAAFRCARHRPRLPRSRHGEHHQRVGGPGHQRQDQDDPEGDRPGGGDVPDQRRVLQGKLDAGVRSGTHQPGPVPPRGRRPAHGADDVHARRQGPRVDEPGGADGGPGLRARRVRHDPCHAARAAPALLGVDGDGREVADVGRAAARRRDGRFAAALPAGVRPGAGQDPGGAGDGDGVRRGGGGLQRDVAVRRGPVHHRGQAEDVHRGEREGHRGRGRHLRGHRPHERAAHLPRGPAVPGGHPRAAQRHHPVRGADRRSAQPV
ncbi:MAG: Serine protease inhibitor (serpin family), partial [uncultured Gemmatimonadetes bacterium]